MQEMHGGGKGYKLSSSEATDKNRRTRGARWTAEEWQSTKEGGRDMSPKGWKELEGYGLWNTDVSGQGRKKRKVAVESGLLNSNMKRYLEEMERLVTAKKGCLGDGQKNRRRPIPRPIWNVNEHTEKVRRRENTLKKHYVASDREVPEGDEKLDVAL